MQTVIIVDDNPRERQFLHDLLSNDYAVQMAANADEAISLVEDGTEPLVVSDIQMPGMNGIDFAKILWDRFPQTRIVFCTHHADEMYIRALAGIIPAETVYGFVLKDNEDETIRRAINAVFTDTQCWIDPKIRPVQARTKHSGTSITDAEYEVLIDIALGMTDNMIAQRRYLSRRGAQSRLKSLYMKLGIEQEKIAEQIDSEALNLRTRAVSVALRRGLINVHELNAAEEAFQQWLARQPR